ncbi:hypothetical protein PF010_g20396 [Phytophthora fragariae]|uniref:Uncharacterized protein n=1 Tax=Phytophthora fragariae TaxID=53985 RepID=A0A6G0KED4_9STRA|nr:hypothetical protein PF010_g20396 [Phytophthora fragariae]
MSDDEDKLLRLLVGKYIKKGKPKGSKVHDTSRMLAQLAFWCDMREALAANEATMGLEILDDVAEVILDELEEAKISKELRDDKYKFPEVPPFDPKETKAPGHTPILTPQGSYTALWKSNSGDDDEDDEEDDGSGSEENDSEEEKPPPPKKAKPSRSSSDSSGGGDTATL